MNFFFVYIILVCGIHSIQAQSDDIFLTLKDLVQVRTQSAAVRVKVPDTDNCLFFILRDEEPRLVKRPCVADDLSQNFFLTPSNQLVVARPGPNGRFYVYSPEQGSFMTRQALTQSLIARRDCTSPLKAGISDTQYAMSCDETTCLQFDQNGNAVFSNENDCDEFLLERIKGDPFTSIKKDAVASPSVRSFNDLRAIMTSLNAAEGRIIFNSDGQSFCLAFDFINEADARPQLYRARCVLERSQIFYRAPAGLFAILPYQNSDTLFELYQIRPEIDDEADVKSTFGSTFNKVTNKADISPADQDRWTITSFASILYYRKGANPTVRIWRLSSFGATSLVSKNKYSFFSAPDTSVCTVYSSFDTTMCSSSAQHLLAFEHIHWCDNNTPQTCEVTINHMWSQYRMAMVGPVLGWKLPTDVRSRWVVKLGAATAVTYTDTRGNGFCWYMNGAGEGELSIALYKKGRDGTDKRELKQFKKIDSSQCTPFYLDKGQGATSEDTTPGYCLILRGDAAGFVRCFTRTYHSDSVRFAPLSDDIVNGTIVEYPSSGSDQCITFVPTATTNSSLRLKTCDSTRSQVFYYGKYSGRLYNYLSQSLFFWWRNNIRPYTQLPSIYVNDGGYYSWSVNTLGVADAIMAQDRRGYSGACFSTGAGGYVLGSQSCNLFKFRPSIPPVSTVYGLSAGIVRIKVKVGDQWMCLVPQYVKKQVSNLLGVGSCDTLKYPEFDGSKPSTQFVIVSTQANTAGGFSGNFAWGSNRGTSMLRPEGEYSQPERFIHGSTWVSYPWFKFKINVETKIFSARDNEPACWTMQNNLLHFFKDQSNCATFYIEPFHKAVDLPDAVLPVTGFVANYFNSPPVAHIDIGYSGRNRYEFRGSAYSINPKTGTISLNPSNNKRTAFVLPTALNLNANGVNFPWVETKPFASGGAKYGLISVRFNPYLESPAPGVSYLLMSNLRHSGCTVYVTSYSRIGVQCFNQGKRFANCQSKKLEMRTLFKAIDFDAFNTASDISISLLYSTVKGVDTVVYLAGYPIINCPTTESWTPTSESIFMFDDPTQWRHRPWGALIRSASFLVSDNRDQLVTVAQRALGGGLYRPAGLTTGSTEWYNCKATIPTLASTVEAVRCNIRLTGDIDPMALTLACSRPGCTLQTVSHYPLVVEYRPNYPVSFKSEPADDLVILNDDAILSDGFSLQTFVAKMTFKSDPTFFLETDEQVGQQDSTDVTDLRRYMSYESFVSIAPYIPVGVGDIF